MHFGREVIEIAVFEDGSGICCLAPPIARGGVPTTESLAPAEAVAPRSAPVRSRSLLADFSAAEILESRLKHGWTTRMMFEDVIQSMAGRIAHARVTSAGEALRRGSGDIVFEQEMLAALAVEDAKPWMIPIRARNIAESIVRSKWEKILLLATVLMGRRRMSGAEICTVLGDLAHETKGLTGRACPTS
jgi:hypothetical protein